MKVCACVLVSVRLTGEEQSDILQLFFTTNSHKPKHSNLQEVVSMLGDDVCGNFIKNNIGPSRVSFRVISTHLHDFSVQTSRWSATFWVCSPVRDCHQFHETTPYGTSTSPVRASQTNHFLNTKKQSSSFLRKILLTKSTMLFQMRKSAQRITLMQRNQKKSHTQQ